MSNRVIYPSETKNKEHARKLAELIKTHSKEE